MKSAVSVYIFIAQQQQEGSVPMPTTHGSWNPAKPCFKTLSFFFPSSKQLLVSQRTQGILEERIA